MIKENDVIKANKNISREIIEGTKGVVLCVFHEEFLIEFIDKNGNTIGKGIETVKNGEIDLYIKVEKKK